MCPSVNMYIYIILYYNMNCAYMQAHVWSCMQYSVILCTYKYNETVQTTCTYMYVCAQARGCMNGLLAYTLPHADILPSHIYLYKMLNYFDHLAIFYFYHVYFANLTQLLVSPGTILEFTNNTASEAGGGLFVSFQNALKNFIAGDEKNRFCFIQYQSSDEEDYPPSQWKVRTVHFKV